MTKSPLFADAFEAVAREHPERVAVDAADQIVTFAELDDWAESIAEGVSERGPSTSPIAILAGHSACAVAGFVAAAKLGRPSIMLDSAAPTARLQQICETGRPGYWVTDKSNAALLTSLCADPAHSVVSFGPERPVGDNSMTASDRKEDSVLSIIFTSGSTGRPKGVVLGDAEFTGEVMEYASMTGVAGRIGCPQPLSFFAGTGSLAMSLLAGGTLFMFDPRREGIDPMVDWVASKSLDMLNVTPHLMRSLARAALTRRVVFPSIQVVASGGEALLASDVRLMRQCIPDSAVIINSSGSSEGWSVSTLVIDSTYELPPNGPVSAGCAIEGRELYLVEKDGTRIEEPGRTGMVMIAARRLSRGYWGSPGLTAERFTELPDGRRTYVTGDLGRWTENGELMYAGRADHMLKIRGYLVEPAEIERHIESEGEVAECVVVGLPTRRDGQLQLVAYVVPRADSWISSSALRRRLMKELSSYMVPSRVIELESLPRNVNGKIDRLSLPAPPREAEDSSPTTSLHHAISSICCTAIGIESIGKHDDIFDFGADSMAVEEILSALDEELHLRIDSATLSEFPTVAGLAELPRRPAPNLIDGVMVTLSERCEGRPVFFVAGAAGLAITFRELASTLDTDRPIYGLQAYGLEGSGLPDLTVHRTAMRYLRAVRQVQPEGPYTFFGHSLGAFVAFEMCRMLRQDGEEISLLGLLDVIGGEDSALVASALANRMLRIAPAGVESASDELADKNWVTRLRARLGMERPYLTRTFWRNLREQRFVSYWELGVSMAKRYALAPGGLSDVPTVLYSAKESVRERQPDLSAYISPPPDLEVVDGDHLTMLRAPFVTHLARRIDARLANGGVRVLS